MISLSIPSFFTAFSRITLLGVCLLLGSVDTIQAQTDRPQRASASAVAANASIASTLELTSVAASVQSGEANVLDLISLRIAEGYVYEARMDHRFVDGFTMEEVETSGRVRVGTDRYRVETADQLISVNGSVSTVFNKRQRKVIISNYYPEEDDFAPSRFIGAYQDRFTITSIEDRPGGLTRVSLESADPFEVITMARLDIDPAGPYLMRMYAEDQTDNVYDVSFSEGTFRSFEEELFSISWPEGTEIIDLRE